MSSLDDLAERCARLLAERTSRRSFLRILGKALVGTAFLMPVLPIARNASAATSGTTDDDDDKTSCDYWRYCATDGFLCDCCGGSVSKCPPGSVPSPISWVGTCHNPHDKNDYIVAYHDCCGQTACDRCYCASEKGTRPGYELFSDDDVNWCMANKNLQYHCTISVIVGKNG